MSKIVTGPIRLTLAYVRLHKSPDLYCRRRTGPATSCFLGPLKSDEPQDALEADLKKTAPSGGSVTFSEAGLPWAPIGVASTPPKLP